MRKRGAPLNFMAMPFPIFRAEKCPKSYFCSTFTMLQKRSEQQQTYRRNNAAANLAVNAQSPNSAADVPPFLRETPTDTRVARGVKRAYSSLDKLSLRIGVALRRYPLARIFVIAYMVNAT